MDVYPQDPGPPNTELLEDDDTTKREPTLHELHYQVYPRNKAEKLWASRLRLAHLPNGDTLAAVYLHHHLDYRLADPSPEAHDFYLVTRPSRVNNPLGSSKHWSIYFRGHFMHLTAPGLPGESKGKSTNDTLSIKTMCQLRHEDLSNPSNEEYLKIVNAPRKKALIAYKVGQTDYRPDQVLRLAREVISRIPVYGLFSANCQHFATEMVRRVVMRLSDRASFLGTAVQIVEWDTRACNDVHVDGLEHGFVVGPPQPIFTTYLQDMKQFLKLALSKRHHDVNRKGREWIEMGFTDDEEHHLSGYDRRMIKEAFQALCGDELGEFKEDIKLRHWKDVILGRRKIQRDGTFRRPFEKKPQHSDIQNEETKINAPG